MGNMAANHKLEKISTSLCETSRELNGGRKVWRDSKRHPPVRGDPKI